MSAPPKLSYADMARRSASAAPAAHAPVPVVAHLPAPAVAHVPAPAVAHVPAPAVAHVPAPVVAHVPAPVVTHAPAAPVRRARANSIGGSLYEGINSGDVKRTDHSTGAVTTISGGEMHGAVRLGEQRGAPAAAALHQQNHEYNDLNLAGPRGDQHAPMGCVEARIESAIAAHHIGLGGRSTKNVKAAWANSASSTLTAVTDQRGSHVPACGWCADRGHK